MQELNFDDLQPVEIVVPVMGQKYVLREPSTDAVTKWRNVTIRAAKMQGSGDSLQVVGMDGLADAEPVLVAGCLFHAEHSKGGEIVAGAPVPINVVRGLPYKVVKKLFEWCKEAGQLDLPETVQEVDKQIKALQERRAKLTAGTLEGDAKNSPEPTTASSS